MEKNKTMMRLGLLIRARRQHSLVVVYFMGFGCLSVYHGFGALRRNTYYEIPWVSIL